MQFLKIEDSTSIHAAKDKEKKYPKTYVKISPNAQERLSISRTRLDIVIQILPADWWTR